VSTDGGEEIEVEHTAGGRADVHIVHQAVEDLEHCRLVREGTLL
jgi:hypothetical protein